MSNFPMLLTLVLPTHAGEPSEPPATAEESKDETPKKTPEAPSPCTTFALHVTAMDKRTTPLADGWPEAGAASFHLAATEAPPLEYSFLQVHIERPGHAFDHQVRWPTPGELSSSISARNLLAPGVTTVFTVTPDGGTACTIDVRKP